MGILKEVQTQVEKNQKFLGVTLYSHKDKMQLHAELRKNEDTTAKDVKMRVANEFKQFKRNKADLIKSLKGSGAQGKKEKVKDMSLGSENQILTESRQNEMVME